MVVIFYQCTPSLHTGCMKLITIGVKNARDGEIVCLSKDPFETCRSKVTDLTRALFVTASWNQTGGALHEIGLFSRESSCLTNCWDAYKIHIWLIHETPPYFLATPILVSLFTDKKKKQNRVGLNLRWPECCAGFNGHVNKCLRHVTNGFGVAF